MFTFTQVLCDLWVLYIDIAFVVLFNGVYTYFIRGITCTELDHCRVLLNVFVSCFLGLKGGVSVENQSVNVWTCGCLYYLLRTQVVPSCGVLRFN